MIITSATLNQRGGHRKELPPTRFEAANAGFYGFAMIFRAILGFKGVGGGGDYYPGNGDMQAMMAAASRQIHENLMRAAKEHDRISKKSAGATT